MARRETPYIEDNMTEEAIAETAPDEEADAIEAPEEVAETESEEEVEEVTSEEDAESEAAEDEEQEEKPDPNQRKIAELSYGLREQKRQNARLMAMLEKQQQSDKTAPEPPKIENFDTFDEYLDARDSYKAALGKTAESKEADTTDLELANFELSRDDMFANGIAKHPDFAEVIGAEDVDISKPMAEALFSIEDMNLQVDTAYYLGNNPREAAKIAQMTPVRQIAEVARISSKIETKRAKAARKPSKAPAPVKPVKGVKTTTDEINAQESFETFMKKRNKQLGRG